MNNHIHPTDESDFSFEKELIEQLNQSIQKKEVLLNETRRRMKEKSKEKQVSSTYRHNHKSRDKSDMMTVESNCDKKTVINKDNKETIQNQNWLASSRTSSISTEVDWTSTYKKWNSWSTLDTLKTDLRNDNIKKKRLEQKLQNRLSSAKTVCCLNTHDKAQERKVASMSSKKRNACMKVFKEDGNQYFKEGQYRNALQQYEQALIYYEYSSFCEASKEKIIANELRTICLLNASICFLRLNRYKETIDYCNQAIATANSDDFQTHIKARFRRAQAYRYFDNFAKANEDLKSALTYLKRSCEYDPTESNNDKMKERKLKFVQNKKDLMYEEIRCERIYLNAKIRSYEISSNILAKKMWQNEASSINDSGSQMEDPKIKTQLEKNERPNLVKLDCTNLDYLNPLYEQPLHHGVFHYKDVDSTISRLSGINLMDASIMNQISKEEKRLCDLDQDKISELNLDLQFELDLSEKKKSKEIPGLFHSNVSVILYYYLVVNILGEQLNPRTI